MGTRAVYTFIDGSGRYSVYRQWDGHPRPACAFIDAAQTFAWPLPRFEADEFAAAFVAANKKHDGDVRLTSGPEAHGDLSYAYEVRCQEGQLHVRVRQAGYAEPLFEGTLDEAQQFAATYR